MLAGIIGQHLYCALCAYCLTVEAVLTVGYVLENGTVGFFVPANNIDKAGLVAKLAADAFFGIIINFMVGTNHIKVFLQDSRARYAYRKIAQIL